jgi:hypothetical protein
MLDVGNVHDHGKVLQVLVCRAYVEPVDGICSTILFNISGVEK